MTDPNLKSLLIHTHLTLIMGAVVAVEVTLVGEHVSIASGVLSANWLKFSRAVTVAFDNSR